MFSRALNELPIIFYAQLVCSESVVDSLVRYLPFIFKYVSHLIRNYWNRLLCNSGVGGIWGEQILLWHFVLQHGNGCPSCPRFLQEQNGGYEKMNRCFINTAKHQNIFFISKYAQILAGPNKFGSFQEENTPHRSSNKAISAEAVGKEVVSCNLELRRVCGHYFILGHN